jgi:hypothetical protein
MSSAPSPAKQSRWMDWKPKARIMADSAESEPSKPSKPGSEGFEGAIPAKSPEIEVAPESPQAAGEQLPSEMDWCLRGISWADWKAAALNRLFQQQGVTGEPGNITAATVRHGEQKRGDQRRRNRAGVTSNSTRGNHHETEDKTGSA